MKQHDIWKTQQKRTMECGKAKKNISVFSLAMANVVGNKKRTIGTILTMGLACVLFVIIANFVGNIDTEYEARKGMNHGQFELKLDYSYEWDEAYPENNLDSILKKNPLNDTLIAEIERIPGVNKVLTREIAVAKINGSKQVVSIVNKEDFEKMRYEGDLGPMDYNEAVRNGDVFFGWSMWMASDGYSLNDPMTFELDNGTEEFTYKGNIDGAFTSADTYLVIPEEVYQAMQPEGVSYGYIWIDTDEGDVASVEQNVRNLIADTSYVKFKTYHDELQTAEFASTMMKLGSYLFMAIAGLIGFMNLANTMIINIITKRQEYGVLQAVGMTNKQLNIGLQLQGLIFTLGTIFVSLVVGLPIGYLLFSYAKVNGVFGMNVYHIPFIPILAMILVVSFLQIVLSFVLSHNLKKATLVERIRYQG
ncbi:ABC transporter permease [Brochothrix campestris]|uniref:ABC transporter permease n=1 Tax=Brochothrix campestris TaxID=2757 RepID=UPI0018DDAE0F|nr:ABC transporter permease [Brochothrix campestris]